MTCDNPIRDSFVKTTVTESVTTYSTEYIERMLFIVVDSNETLPYVYLTDVTEDTVLPTAADYVSINYFYRDVKSCDVLLLNSATVDLDTVLSDEDKASINCRTFTASIDKRAHITTIPIPLIMTFFKGVIQYSTSINQDTTTLPLDPRVTLIYHKTLTDSITFANAENAKFASFFVNRKGLNFYQPITHKILDYIYDPNGNYDELTTADLDLAKSNQMTALATGQGYSKCICYNAGLYNTLIPYYIEKIDSDIKNDITVYFERDSIKPYYNIFNVRAVYGVIENNLAIFEAEPYGFLNPEGTKITNKYLNINQIPRDDFNNGLLRVSIQLNFYTIIRQININLNIIETNVTVDSEVVEASFFRNKEKKIEAKRLEIESKEGGN